MLLVQQSCVNPHKPSTTTTPTVPRTAQHNAVENGAPLAAWWPDAVDNSSSRLTHEVDAVRYVDFSSSEHPHARHVQQISSYAHPTPPSWELFRVKILTQVAARACALQRRMSPKVGQVAFPSRRVSLLATTAGDGGDDFGAPAVRVWHLSSCSMITINCVFAGALL